jgi:hypothetical protein
MEHFREVVAREFAFLLEDLGFRAPVYAESGGDLVATFEDGSLAIVVESGKRDASVWTLLKHLTLGRQLGLDSFHYSHVREPEYPPFMGGAWESQDEFRERLGLEARILRANFPAIRQQRETFEEVGSIVTADAVDLSDPVQTFPRRCSERLRFLVDELGLREQVVTGSEVLYIGTDRVVRVELAETAFGHEDQAHPTLEAEVAPIIGPGGEFPPFHDDAIDLDISERSGPFTATYLEKAFDELEKALRSFEPQLRQRGHG